MWRDAYTAASLLCACATALAAAQPAAVAPPAVHKPMRQPASAAEAPTSQPAAAPSTAHGPAADGSAPDNRKDSQTAAAAANSTARKTLPESACRAAEEALRQLDMAALLGGPLFRPLLDACIAELQERLAAAAAAALPGRCRHELAAGQMQCLSRAATCARTVCPVMAVRAVGQHARQGACVLLQVASPSASGRSVRSQQPAALWTASKGSLQATRARWRAAMGSHRPWNWRCRCRQERCSLSWCSGNRCHRWRGAHQRASACTLVVPFCCTDVCEKCVIGHWTARVFDVFEAENVRFQLRTAF